MAKGSTWISRPPLRMRTDEPRNQLTPAVRSMLGADRFGGSGRNARATKHTQATGKVHARAEPLDVSPGRRRPPHASLPFPATWAGTLLGRQPTEATMRRHGTPETRAHG